jgi:hypothetical protein
VFDSETETESITIREINYISVNDLESTSENASIREVNVVLSVFDSEVITESISINEHIILSVFDAESISESVTLIEETFGTLKISIFESDLVTELIIVGYEEVIDYIIVQLSFTETLQTVQNLSLTSQNVVQLGYSYSWGYIVRP